NGNRKLVQSSSSIIIKIYLIISSSICLLARRQRRSTETIIPFKRTRRKLRRRQPSTQMVPAHIQLLQPRNRARHLPKHQVPRHIQILHRLHDPHLPQIEAQLVPRRPELHQVIRLVQQPNRAPPYLILRYIQSTRERDILQVQVKELGHPIQRNRKLTSDVPQVNKVKPIEELELCEGRRDRTR
ncbi:hypothetical protein LINPERHAP1_LOCUS42457, partial [Linum perenne]